MPDDLLPAEFALPDGVDPPFSDELLDTIGTDADLPSSDIRPVIVDRAGAEYTMARLARVDRHLAELTAQRAAWMRKVDEWYRAETAGFDHRRAFLEDLLEAWALAERRTNPKGPATFRVPSGEVGTTAQRAPSVVIPPDESGKKVDPRAEEAIIKWAADVLPADAYDLVVKTETSVRISELRKLVVVVDNADPTADDYVPDYLVVYQFDPDNDTTRELVPGVVVEPPSTTAKVRPLV